MLKYWVDLGLSSCELSGIWQLLAVGNCRLIEVVMCLDWGFEIVEFMCLGVFLA